MFNKTHLIGKWSEIMGEARFMQRIPGYSTLRQGTLLLKGVIRGQRERLTEELAPALALRENLVDDVVQLGITVANLDQTTLGSINRIREYAEILRSNNLYISLLSASGREALIPTSNAGSIIITLSQARLFVRLREIEHFLESLINLYDEAGEEIPRGKLDLIAAMEQFNRGVNKLLEQDRERLKAGYMITAVRDNRVVGSNVALANQFKEITGMVTNILTASLAEAVKSFVFTAQRVFPGGAPAFMLFEPGFFIPYGVALRDEYISAAEDKLDKFLGKYKIRITPDSKNAFVQAFLEAEKKGEKLLFERDITKKRYREICGGFINEQVVGIKARFFEGISFPEGENENLFAILRSEERIIGILAITKRGHFSREDMDKVDVLIHEAETKLGYILEREERKSKERQLEIAVKEAQQAEKDAKAYAEKQKEYAAKLKSMQDDLIESERRAQAGRTAADIYHNVKNIWAAATGDMLNVAKNLRRMEALLEILCRKQERGLLIDNDLERIFHIERQLAHLTKEFDKRLVEANDEVRGVLSMAKRGDKNPVNIPVQNFLTKIIKSYRSAFKKRGIVFYDVLRLESDDAIYIEEGKFKALLANLLQNALEAFGEKKESVEKEDVSPRSKTVQLWAVPGMHGKGTVTIRVRDTGSGIPEEILSKIINGEGITSKKDGTGIGWRTIRSILDEYDARLEVETSIEKPDSGTTFDIIFPLVKIDKQKVAVATDSLENIPVISPSQARNIPVLLVEDEGAVLEHYLRVLKDMGFPVDTSYTAANALKRLKENACSPKLIITDEGLDKEEGHKFLEEVAALYEERGMERPHLAIYSAADSPTVGPVAEIISRLGIPWIDKIPGQKGTEIFKRIIGIVALGGELPQRTEGFERPVWAEEEPIAIFAGLLAHEIKNKLTAIYGNLSFYRICKNQGSNTGEALESIKEGFNNLRETLQSIRDFIELAKTRNFEDLDREDTLLPERIMNDGKFIKMWGPEKEAIEPEKEAIGPEKETIRPEKETIEPIRPEHRYSLAAIAMIYLDSISDEMDRLEDPFDNDEFIKRVAELYETKEKDEFLNELAKLFKKDDKDKFIKKIARLYETKEKDEFLNELTKFYEQNKIDAAISAIENMGVINNSVMLNLNADSETAQQFLAYYEALAVYPI